MKKQPKNVKQPKFERSLPQGHLATKDEAGKIRIQVFLSAENGFHASGNISRAFTIKRAKVSAVARAIERALFGKVER